MANTNATNNQPAAGLKTQTNVAGIKVRTGVKAGGGSSGTVKG